MESDDDDVALLKFQNLMQSIPVYDGSPKQNVWDFPDIVENVAELGAWTDEQKVRVAGCRVNGIAATIIKSELIKVIKTFKDFRAALEKNFDYASNLSTSKFFHM